MERLEKYLLARDGMTNIIKSIDGCFDQLTVDINGQEALLQGLEFFFKLNGPVVFVVIEKRSKRGPEIGGGGGASLRQDHA